MTRIVHQLVHTLSYGDAISGEVLALQRVLRSIGFQSEIYAINVHPKLKGRAIDYREFPSGFDGEVILHYSLGSPLNDLYLGLTSATRGLIYHNLTPPSWFKGVNPRIVRDLEAGLEELPKLCQETDRLLADSDFNAAELESFGFKAEVLELCVDLERWDLEENSGIAALIDSDPGMHILHVGRLAPNKCIEDIIKSFYFLHHKIDERSKLWLVGIDIDTELYSFELKRLVRELALHDAVKFVGCLADSELKALYRRASAYLCMSEHEGFCLPVVEAMHFGVPVVAYASSAVPATIGSGGVLVHEKRHAEIAELVAEIHTNTALREKLSVAGKKRAAELSYSRFEKAVKSIFGNPGAKAQAASA